MEISRQRDAFAFRTATDEHVPNAPAGHRSPEPPFGLSKDGWWHGSPAGDLRGAFYGLHVGTYDAARQALESRIGTPADGKPWDGTRTLGETLLAYGVPGTPYYREYHVGDGVPGETTGGPWDYTQVTYSDGTPVPLDSKPTMLPVRITGPMTNTPDNPHTDARANALMKGLITRGQARRGFYYVNDSEDENSISAVVPNADHLEIYHPDLGWHSYNAPITAALNMIRTAEEAHLEWDHSFSTGEWELEKADEQRIIDVMRKRHEMSQGQNRSATRKLAKDIVLYRGFGLDFREPGMEKIKAITHPHFDAVPGESLVEAYDRSQKDEAEGVYDHPDLGPHILDYLSSGRGPGGYTLGSHWTPDISVAQDWSRHRGRTPVVLKVRIPGDTKKKTFNPGWKYEKEWPMPAGTPVNVEEVHLWNPRDVVWHNVLQEPSVRYASMDPILLAQNMIRVAENNLIDDDEWEIIDKINDHLSNGRPASAVAVWMQNMIPIYHLSRAPEIIHAYERMHPTGTNRTSQQFAEAQASAFDIDTFNAEVAPVLSDLAMQRYTRRVNESYRDNPDFDEDSDDDYHDPRITPSNPYGDDEDDDYDDDDEEEEKEEETDLDGGHYDEVGVFHPEFEHFQKLIDTPSDSRKLKSPWSHRVVHYTTNRPIPQELRGKPKDAWDWGGDLYGDFEFGGPAFWDLKDPNYGVYQINHPRDEMHKPPVGYLQYHQTIDADDNPTIHIDYLDTHPNYRLQGVATALMNALAQDYPNHRIDPGFTTEHGTGFTNFMRENAPGAQDRLNTETWSPSSPNVVSDDQMKDWGVKKKRSPVFASLNMIRQAEKILAFYEQDFYIPTKGELEEADHPKSWRQLLKELFHPEDDDAIVKASKAIRASTQVLGSSRA